MKIATALNRMVTTSLLIINKKKICLVSTQENDSKTRWKKYNNSEEV